MAESRRLQRSFKQEEEVFHGGLKSQDFCGLARLSGPISAALPSCSLLRGTKLVLILRKIHRQVEMRNNSCRKIVVNWMRIHRKRASPSKVDDLTKKLPPEEA